MDATTVAIDLAKDVFEVALANRAGQIRERKRLTRPRFERFLNELPAGTEVVMEACGTAHYWGRRCQARGLAVRLLPATVCPPIRPSQQNGSHRYRSVTRGRAVWRGAAGAREDGRAPDDSSAPLRALAVAGGPHRAHQPRARAAARAGPPDSARRAQGARVCREHPGECRALRCPACSDPPWHSSSTRFGTWKPALPPLINSSRRSRGRTPSRSGCSTVPGVGVLTATALVAAVPHIHAFRRGRAFASWLGLTPREYSSGGHRRLGGISKRGDRYLRCLLTHGARVVLLDGAAESPGDPGTRHAVPAMGCDRRRRRGHNKAAIAVANKMARTSGRCGITTWTIKPPREVPSRRNEQPHPRDAQRGGHDHGVTGRTGAEPGRYTS